MMPGRGRYLVFLSSIFAVVCASAPADVLIMRDGSRLLGTVVSGDAGVVELETTYAGVIRVKWSEVQEMKTDKPVQLLIEGGDLLEITGADNSGEWLTLETVDGSGRELQPGNVAFINPAPWRLGEGYRWTGNINTDLKVQQGNADKDEFEADFITQFRRVEDRARFEGQFEKDKTNGDLTDENWLLNGKYDRFINEKLYYGATLGLEHDEFADKDLRTIIGPHLGYQFFETPGMNLGVDAGLMFVDEDFIEAPDDDHIALGWHVNFDKFLVPERIQFYHRHHGLLDVGEPDKLVLNTWTGFRFPLYAGIVASAEAEIEYDGGVSDEVDKTDTTYRFKLGYMWD